MPAIHLQDWDTAITIAQVDAYARMLEQELAALPYIPRSVLPLIRQLRRAHALLACWQPIVALR